MIAVSDAATSEAIVGFHQALAQSKAALQQEQEQLQRAAALLGQLRHACQQLADATHAHPLALQKVPALEKERDKLRHTVAALRREEAQQQQQLAQLRQPREAAEAAAAELEAAVRAMQKRYALQAGALHQRVGLQLQPGASLDALEAAQAQAVGLRSEAEAAAALAAERRREQLALLASLTKSEDAYTATPADQPVPIQPEEATRPENETKMGTDHRLPLAPKGSPLQTLPEAYAALDALATAHAAQTAAQAAQVFDLRAAREQLTGQLRRLCIDVEAADAAQQTALRALHDAVDAAGAVGAAAGGSRDAAGPAAVAAAVCRSCGAEVLTTFL